MEFKTIIEPFKIHSVAPIAMTTESEREKFIAEVGYNLFSLESDNVLVDLLTDSGTGAMSRNQWAAIQHGDESYAGSPSWLLFRAAVQNLFPYKHVIPTHQGRAAEKILFTAIALGCSIPGGEVTPLFVVGATLGSALSGPLHLSPTLAAAACLAAVFGAAANAPIACAVLAIELFGADMAVPAGIVCIVAYAISPKHGIYEGQRHGSTKDLRATAAQPHHS